MALYIQRRPEVRPNGEVRRLRAFPALGQVEVAPGSEVTWETTLGHYASRQRLRFVRVESSGDSISATVLVGVGQKVKRGEVLAYYSFLFGLGFTEYTSPCDGEVVEINNILGAIAIKEALVPLVSNMPGKVVQADDALGVTVANRGDLVYGVAGAGYGRSGVLEVKVSSPDGLLRPGDLSAKDAGKVLLAGRTVSQDLLEACLRWRVAGIVAGSVPYNVYRWYKDISEKLDWDEFLARYWARELKEKNSKVPPPMEISTSLVVTEGFGDEPMNQAAFKLLSKHAGERVFLDGSGAFQSQAAGSDETVPCVFVPTPGVSQDEAGAQMGLAVLQPGDRVKIYGLTGAPQEAHVVDVAGEDIVLETGMSAPGVKVRLVSGEEQWIPLFNVEKAD
ncbi:MAG: hypothetical protein ACM3WU_11840 [Bacillota bacterium]